MKKILSILSFVFAVTLSQFAVAQEYLGKSGIGRDKNHARAGLAGCEAGTVVSRLLCFVIL